MSSKWRRGGRFLFEQTAPADIFTLEDFDEDARLLGETAAKFARKEAVPAKDLLEAEDTKIETNIKLLRKAGELGLLMTEIPEKYGGLEQNIATSMLVAESAAQQPSFTCTMMCQTGIGSLPILFFGSEQQRAKYLPKLATGELIGAFALTEAGCGSDALNAKTKAVQSDDGAHWILNGSKIFITNAGIADVFTVFAKVDGGLFTAFIVEADTPGVSTGPEEHKMGIKGSSTRELILDQVEIPKGNLLGEIGRGHRVALDTLNIGRLKLGFSGLASSRETLRHCLEYAAERMQFGKPIGSYQLIKRKLADMALEAYAIESMGYRCAGDIDRAIEALETAPDDANYLSERVACIEEYAAEDAIMKVYGSEAQGRVIDEGVQVFGGYGYIEDYPVCALYRDARITPLFEGTNEINRMLIPGTVMRRALKGKLDLMTPVSKLLAEIKANAVGREPLPGPLGRECAAVDIIRKLALFGYAVAAKKAMADPKYLMENQILLELLADVTMELYAAESCALRTLKRIGRDGEEASRIPIVLTRVIVYEKLRRANELARQICADASAGDDKDFSKNLKALSRLQLDYGLDTMSLKAEIADHLRARQRYSLE